MCVKLVVKSVIVNEEKARDKNKKRGEIICDLVCMFLLYLCLFVLVSVFWCIFVYGCVYVCTRIYV